MNRTKDIIWGVIIVLLGVMVGLKSFDIIDFDIFFDGWWTLFIIIPCLIGIITERDKSGNLIGLLIGVFLLLSCLNITSFDLLWKLMVPIILVVIGLSLIFKNSLNKEIDKEIKKLSKGIKDSDGCFATFSSQNVSFEDEEFKGTNLTAVFGGIKCDLREAKLDKDVVINTCSIFGGIDILVPDNVKVKIKSTSIFGGVDDKKKKRSNDGKVIYINAICIFGGTDIK